MYDFMCVCGITVATFCMPIPKRTSRLMLLSSCEQKFADFLQKSKLLQEGTMIAG